MLKISDFFFNFWLRFVYPYKEDISLDIYDFHAFEKEFSRYMGIVFEDICIDALTALMKNNKIPLKFIDILPALKCEDSQRGGLSYQGMDPR